MSEEISLGLDLQSTLNTIVGLAKDLVQADIVTLHLYDSPTQTFQLYSGVGAGRDFGTPRDKGVTMHIAGTRKPLISNRAQTHALFRSSPFTRTRNIQSVAGFPLLVDSIVAGVLYINYRAPGQITACRRKRIAEFARLAASAIENSTLLRALTILYQPKEALFAQDMRTVLQGIVDIAAESLKIDIVTLYEYDNAKKQFILPPASSGTLRHPEIPQRFEIYPDDAAWIILQKDIDAYFARDSATDPIMNPPSREQHEVRPKERFVVREEIVSSGIIQLKAGGQPVGVMFVNFRTPQTFSEKQQALFKLFASHAAFAIQNTRAHQQAREQLGRAMQQLGEEQKRALDFQTIADETTFAVAFAHRMNNIAGTFTLKIETLRDDFKKAGITLTDDSEQLLRSLEFDAQQLEEMARRARKGIGEKPALVSLSVNELLDEVVKGTVISPDITVRKLYDQQLPRISTDREWVIDVIRTLISNAIEAMQERGGELGLFTAVEAGYIQVKIKDTGVGIPATQVKRLFIPLAGGRGSGHLGLGLWTARNQIRRLGGNLDLLESRAGEGTIFAFTLPIEIPSYLRGT